MLCLLFFLAFAGASAGSQDPRVRTAGALKLTSQEYDGTVVVCSRSKSKLIVSCIADLPELPGSDFVRNGFDVTNDTVSQVVSDADQTSRLPVYAYTYTGQQTWTNPYTQK